MTNRTQVNTSSLLLLCSELLHQPTPGQRSIDSMKGLFTDTERCCFYWILSHGLMEKCHICWKCKTCLSDGNNDNTEYLLALSVASHQIHKPVRASILSSSQHVSCCGRQKLRAPQLEKEGGKTPNNQINIHDASCQTITNPTKQDVGGVARRRVLHSILRCSAVKEHCNRGLVVSVAMAAYKKNLYCTSYKQKSQYLKIALCQRCFRGTVDVVAHQEFPKLNIIYMTITSQLSALDHEKLKVPHNAEFTSVFSL